MATKAKEKTAQAAQVERLLQDVVEAERHAERRRDERIDTSIVVAVVPCRDGRPVSAESFATMTKNISAEGISLIVNRHLAGDELFVGFPGQNDLSFVRARIRYRERMALGCHKLGLFMDEVVRVDSWPELKDVACFRAGM
jgi:hypothetical protein